MGADYRGFFICAHLCDLRFPSGKSKGLTPEPRDDGHAAERRKSARTSRITSSRRPYLPSAQSAADPARTSFHIRSISSCASTPSTTAASSSGSDSIFFNKVVRSDALMFGTYRSHRARGKCFPAIRSRLPLLRSVHLNPVRSRDKNVPIPAERRTALAEYSWSSHRAYLGREPAPKWLCTQWLSFFWKAPRRRTPPIRPLHVRRLWRCARQPVEKLPGRFGLGRRCEGQRPVSRKPRAQRGFERRPG